MIAKRRGRFAEDRVAEDLCRIGRARDLDLRCGECIVAIGAGRLRDPGALGHPMGLAARELHDVVAHQIAVINVQSGVAEHLQPASAGGGLDGDGEAGLEEGEADFDGVGFGAARDDQGPGEGRPGLEEGKNAERPERAAQQRQDNAQKDPELPCPVDARRFDVDSDIDASFWYDASGRWVKCAFETQGSKIDYVLRALPK